MNSIVIMTIESRYDHEVLARGFVEVDTMELDYRVEVERTVKPESISLDLEVIKSPLPGRVVQVIVNEGDFVEKGQALVLIESMKMISEIKSQSEGFVRNIYVDVGNSVARNDRLLMVGIL